MKRAAPGTYKPYSKYSKPKRARRAPKAAVLPKAERLELKVLDTAQAFNFDATGEVPTGGQLSLVVTGDTLANRDGAVIQVKSIQLRGNATFVPAAAATAASTAYLYIVQDRQANGAAAAITDVLTSANMGTAFPEVPNQFRFKILKRITMTFHPQAGVTTAYNNSTCVVEEYIKFRTPIEMRYKASAGAVTDLASNNLFLLAGTDGNTDDTIIYAGTSRLRFTG